MTKKWICLLLMLVMILPACKKILDIDRGSDSNPTPVTVSDFEQLLNTQKMCETPFFELCYLTDELGGRSTTEGATVDQFYFGAVDPWGGQPDNMFPDLYKWVAQMNLLIAQMPMALPAGDNGRRALAIAQAKINRASFYLQLVNTYAKHYQATAASDLGVPLILEVNNQISYPRATVEQVYQQILKDLQEALATPELQNEGDIVHPKRATAFALLARTYLYMGKYPEASDAASGALAINSQLLDYRGYQTPGSADGRLVTLVDQIKNPEVLLARISLANSSALGASFYPSTELLALFDQTNDKRYTASINNQGAYLFSLRGSTTYLNNNIGVPEMMLTKAECLARANDAVGAVNLLNTLRAKRIVNYQALATNINADAALRLVLDERRRELILMGGTRLFDLKRLNLDPRFKKDLERRDRFGKYVATIPAGSPNYVVPFTRAIMNANPLLVQNPRVKLQ